MENSSFYNIWKRLIISVLSRWGDFVHVQADKHDNTSEHKLCPTVISPHDIQHLGF